MRDDWQSIENDMDKRPINPNEKVESYNREREM